jgi:hypothetical protein
MVSFLAKPEDKRLIRELKEKLTQRLGDQNISDILRMGLRKLAEAEGIQ